MTDRMFSSDDIVTIDLALSVAMTRIPTGLDPEVLNARISDAAYAVARIISGENEQPTSGTDEPQSRFMLDELSDDAQERAVEEIREKLAGDWWDSADNEDIGATMLYTLAEKCQAPGWDTFGVADFPADGFVKVMGWSLDRGQELAVSGTLTRDNAPGLPWVDGIDEIRLTEHRSGSTIELMMGEGPCACDPDSYLAPHDDDCPSLGPATPDETARDALESAVRDALHDAWRAGEREAEHKTSTEYAREAIEANLYQFDKDGSFLP